jgi:hypothetical protein
MQVRQMTHLILTPRSSAKTANPTRRQGPSRRLRRASITRRGGPARSMPGAVVIIGEAGWQGRRRQSVSRIANGTRHSRGVAAASVRATPWPVRMFLANPWQSSQRVHVVIFPSSILPSFALQPGAKGSSPSRRPDPILRPSDGLMLPVTETIY